jgi:hypothetical protein
VPDIAGAAEDDLTPGFEHKTPIGHTTTHKRGEKQPGHKKQTNNKSINYYYY